MICGKINWKTFQLSLVTILKWHFYFSWEGKVIYWFGNIFLYTELYIARLVGRYINKVFDIYVNVIFLYEKHLIVFLLLNNLILRSINITMR